MTNCCIVGNISNYLHVITLTVGNDFLHDILNCLSVLQIHLFQLFCFLHISRNVILVFQLFVSAEMLELCFESTSAALAEDTPDILPVCSVTLQLLHTLLKSRESLVLDCIPSLLQCYQQLSTTIASHAHVDLKYSPEQIKSYAVCAHRLERWVIYNMAISEKLSSVVFPIH
jgi:hypothetical protein